MAPPAGTSTMLRYRRRDATLKPNRTLDRSASRGMLYENEELRLRTININAEVEKGQNYIKKLRRENEQLKREIWNLREEYERLENYVKSREQSENEEEDEDAENDRIVISEKPVEDATETLETVVEEDDGEVDGQNAGPPSCSLIPDVANGSDSDRNDNRDAAVAAPADQQADIVVMVVVDTATDTAAGGRTEHAPSPVTADDMPVTQMGCEGVQPESGGCLRQDLQQPVRLAVDRGDGQEDQPVDRKPESQSDAAAVLQPHTACFDTGNNRQLYDLTVDEVIEAVQDADLRDKLRTVCLTDDRCYMTFANAECLERALHSAVFRVRDVPVLLMDTGAGAVILSLTGVPDTVTDKDVLKCLKKYGTIIGGVDRKTGRGRTTAGGERYVRVRPTVGAPRYLWFGSDKVTVRQLTEHETGTMNSIARRKSFRSQIKLNLKMADPSPQPLPQQPSAALVVGSSESSPASTTGACVESNGNGIGNGVRSAAATTATAVSVQNGFRFPSDTSAKTATGPSAPVTEPKTAPVAPASPNKPTTASGSLRKSKPVASNDSCPPQTVGAAESPLRGRRRASLMGFRSSVIKHRGGSVSRMDGEDADSDTSTICRRKLSITGHENTEKVPWCGCWGNGCL